MGNGASLQVCDCAHDESERAAFSLRPRGPGTGEPVYANPNELIPLTTLHKLCAAGAKEDVHYMLAQGHAGVNEVDRHGRSAMHFAAARGDISMIQVLLRHGGKIDIRDAVGKTPQMFAAERCDGEVVRYLVLVQRAAQFSGGSAVDHQDLSSPACLSDTKVGQQLHYKRVLEQQRQLLERVAGRSTPASSQKSSASTETNSPKRLDDDLRKAPAAESHTPALFPAAATASGADTAFVFDGPPTEHATLSLRRPSVHMTPREARLSMTHADQEEVVHDFEGTLVGRNSSHNIVSEDIDGKLNTRNFAALADYTCFPTASSPGAYERAKRISIYEQYRRVHTGIKISSLSRHGEHHTVTPPRRFNASHTHDSVSATNTWGESGSLEGWTLVEPPLSNTVPGVRNNGAEAMVHGGGVQVSGVVPQVSTKQTETTAEFMGFSYFVSDLPSPELAHQDIAHIKLPQTSHSPQSCLSSETTCVGQVVGYARKQSVPPEIEQRLPDLYGRGSASGESHAAPHNYPAKGEVTAVL